MNVSITSRKFKARDTLKEYIQAEVISLEKYNDSILNAFVILSYQNNKDSIKTAEVVLQIPGKTLKATETSDEYKKSVNAAIEKISRQLRKLKTKRAGRVK